MKRAVIIGAGLGGLAAAITLQNKGFQTTLIEKNNHTGGKLHEVCLGSASFDFGPNTITMPQVFNEVVRQTGEEPENFFQFQKLTNHTTNSFKDGSSFMFSSDNERMKEELLSLDGYAADHFSSYLKEVKKLHDLAQNYFLRRTFKSWKDYLSLPLTKGLISSRPLETLDHFHRRYFKDERVISAFNRYATYIGSSPYSSPATFGLIGYLELGQGVFYTKGGNHKIAEGLEKLALKIGVDIRTAEEAQEIAVSKKTATLVVTDKSSYEADVVVLNGDLLTQYPRLIKETDRPSLSDKKIDHFEPSVSASVMLAATNKSFPLNHHHVFFGEDPRKEFTNIFEKGLFSDDPTIYICTSAKTEPARSPEGDNLFILVNAPPLHKKDASPSLKEEIIFNVLKKHKIDISPYLEAKKMIHPEDIKNKFHAFRGALYGLSSNDRKNTFLRPYNRSADINNLYFTGGSTHPGGGSPMVTLSGLNVGNLISKIHG
nr:phytoene desaturase family protein [Alkalicoccus daliensis]